MRKLLSFNTNGRKVRTVMRDDSLLLYVASKGEADTSAPDPPDPDPPTVDPPIIPQDANVAIGMNLNRPDDFNEQPLRNLARGACVWLNKTNGVVQWNDRGNVSIMPADPLQDPIDANNTFAGSIFVNAKAGETFYFRVQDLTFRFRNQDYTSDFEYTYSADQGTEFVEVTARNDAGSPDLGCFHKGHENITTLLSPNWATAAGIFGTGRYMDWNHTNHSVKVNLSDTVTASAFCQCKPRINCNEKLCFDAAAELNQDCWVTTPHLASDAYVDHIATLAINFINATGRQAVIEYSNECWNRLFAQSNYMLQYANENGISGQNESQIIDKAYGVLSAKMHKRLDLSGFPYRRAVCWQATASASYHGTAVIEAYEQEYGAKPEIWGIAPYCGLKFTKNIFRPLYAEFAPATYAQNPWMNSTHLTASELADVDNALYDRWTTQDIVDQMLNDPSDGLQRSIDSINEHGAFALSHGMAFWCYEGGNHLQLNDGGEFRPHETWANDHFYPAMDAPEWETTIYPQIQSAFDAAGGERFVYFTLFQSRTKGLGFGHAQSIEGTQDPQERLWRAVAQLIPDN